MNIPMPDRMVYAIFRNTDYSIEEVRNLTNNHKDIYKMKTSSK